MHLNGITIPECSKIKNELALIIFYSYILTKWIPKIGLDQMCKDSYNFVKMHLNGLFSE